MNTNDASIAKAIHREREWPSLKPRKPNGGKITSASGVCETWQDKAKRLGVEVSERDGGFAVGCIDIDRGYDGRLEIRLFYADDWGSDAASIEQDEASELLRSLQVGVAILEAER